MDCGKLLKIYSPSRLLLTGLAMEEDDYLSLPEYARECYWNMVGWIQYARAVHLTSDDEQEFAKAIADGIEQMWLFIETMEEEVLNDERDPLDKAPCGNES